MTTQGLWKKLLPNSTSCAYSDLDILFINISRAKCLIGLEWSVLMIHISLGLIYLRHAVSVSFSLPPSPSPSLPLPGFLFVINYLFYFLWLSV